MNTIIPWTFRAAPDPNREYIVAVTTGLQADWRNLRRLLAFPGYTLRILQELKETPGCVGFALRASFWPVQGATISVWEEMETLRRFYTENAHGEALRVLRSEQKSRGQFQYVQWKCRGEALPHTWDEAETHFKSSR